MSPIRVQRSRRGGWKAPAGAVYVGRPTIFGNPWDVSLAAEYLTKHPIPGWTAHDLAVACFRNWLRRGPGPEVTPANPFTFRAELVRLLAALSKLRGKDLMCWCPLDVPCHADVLLELANASNDPMLPMSGCNGWEPMLGGGR